MSNEQINDKALLHQAKEASQNGDGCALAKLLEDSQDGRRDILNRLNTTWLVDALISEWDHLVDGEPLPKNGVEVFHKRLQTEATAPIGLFNETLVVWTNPKTGKNVPIYSQRHEWSWSQANWYDDCRQGSAGQGHEPYKWTKHRGPDAPQDSDNIGLKRPSPDGK